MLFLNEYFQARILHCPLVEVFMEMNNNTEAMRALSKLYRIEAERMASTDSPEIALLKAQLRAVQTSRAALDQKIRDVAQRAPSRSGISHESAWKILTVTLALTTLFGFLTALFFSGVKHPESSVSPKPQDAPTLRFAKVPPPEAANAIQVATNPNTVEAVSTKPEDRSPARRGRHSGTGINSKREKGGKQTKPNTLTPPPKDDFDFFDKCGKDPMCGFDKKTERSR